MSIHLHQCKVCHKVYRTRAIESKKCDNCKLPNRSGKKIRNEVI